MIEAPAKLKGEEVGVVADTITDISGTGVASDLNTDPIIGLASDPAPGPVIDPVTDLATDPTADPATDATADPATDPTADPATDPTADPANDPTADPATEPGTETGNDDEIGVDESETDEGISSASGIFYCHILSKQGQKLSISM